mmetsp:Transcript_25020/g.80649  ORF Transcript_25020/g.80649 Transcript_25020/m.80649 type:complete len:285 (-) Transcript_25020:241-1095(-)
MRAALRHLTRPPSSPCSDPRACSPPLGWPPRPQPCRPVPGWTRQPARTAWTPGPLARTPPAAACSPCSAAAPTALRTASSVRRDPPPAPAAPAPGALAPHPRDAGDPPHHAANERFAASAGMPTAGRDPRWKTAPALHPPRGNASARTARCPAGWRWAAVRWLAPSRRLASATRRRARSWAHRRVWGDTNPCLGWHTRRGCWACRSMPAAACPQALDSNGCSSGAGAGSCWPQPSLQRRGSGKACRHRCSPSRPSCRPSSYPPSYQLRDQPRAQLQPPRLRVPG